MVTNMRPLLFYFLKGHPIKIVQFTNYITQEITHSQGVISSQTATICFATRKTDQIVTEVWLLSVITWYYKIVAIYS